MRATTCRPVEVNDGVVVMDPAMAISLGVVVVEAQLAPVARAIRTTGSVTYDETRLTTITPKFNGFAERLHVNFTGQPVRRGQPLLEVYSPELVAAQEELLSALRMTAQLRASASPAVIERTAGLVDAARRRLLLWDISSAQVRQIEQSGEVRRTLTMHSPSSGFVTEKMVQEGQSIGMGMPLYRLADLSTVWIEADVYEQDLRFVEARRGGAGGDHGVSAGAGQRARQLHPSRRTWTRAPTAGAHRTGEPGRPHQARHVCDGEHRRAGHPARRRSYRAMR
jgi:multidrug efflux pump subunit AcrA (membrane-fusion protein)